MGNALALINPITIHSGDILSYPNATYSVVYMNEFTDEMVLFERDTTQLHGFEYPISNVLDDIRTGTASVCPYIETIVPDTENELYKLRVSLINELIPHYKPTFLGLLGRKTKVALNEIQEKFGVCKMFLWKTIRIYLQSGCRVSALYPDVNKERSLDPNKQYLRRGRKAEEDYLQSDVIVDDIIDIFEEYKNRILSKHFFTIEAAYEDMLGKYFSKCDVVTENGKKALNYSLLPRNEIPTLRQFQYWYKNHTTRMQREIAKTSVLEYKNNHRLLYGDTFSNAHGPGYICEADHWEIPVQVISKYSNDCVSKPVLAVMVDEYSGLPVSVNISFDNNSNIALTSLMQVLAEPKKELCARYGVTLKDERLWPSCFYPSILRVDSGSDFLSENTRRFCKENGIELQPVTPGMGSYKPKVERFFNTIKAFLVSLLEGKGYVSGRHDSKPQQEAVLTIDQLAKIIYEFVIMYNQTIMNNFKPTKEMIEKGIERSPIAIWEYGCEKYGKPRPITDKLHYYYSLLIVDEKSKIFRDGIHSHGLQYTDIKNKELRDKMALAGKKGIPFQVRFDPRNISYVYYIHDDYLVAVPLKSTAEQQSFKDLSLYELTQYKKTNGRQKRLANAYKLEYQVTTRINCKAVVHQAELAQKLKPGTKDVKGNRTIEQNAVSKNHSIVNDINKQKVSSQNAVTPSVSTVSQDRNVSTVETVAPSPSPVSFSQDELTNAMIIAGQEMENEDI